MVEVSLVEKQQIISKIGLELIEPYVTRDKRIINRDVAALILSASCGTNEVYKSFYIPAYQYRILESNIYIIKDIFNLLGDIYSKSTNAYRIQWIYQMLLEEHNLLLLKPYLEVIKSNLNYIDVCFLNHQEKHLAESMVVNLKGKIEQAVHDNLMRI